MKRGPKGTTPSKIKQSNDLDCNTFFIRPREKIKTKRREGGKSRKKYMSSEFVTPYRNRRIVYRKSAFFAKVLCST